MLEPAHLRRLALATRIIETPITEDEETFGQISKRLIPNGIKFITDCEPSDGQMRYFWPRPEEDTIPKKLYDVVFDPLLTVDRIKSYFRQAVVLVQFLHRRNIVSGKLSPMDFEFVDNDCLDIITLDWRWMTITKDNDDRISTTHPWIHFAAPETFDGAPDGRSGKAMDVWALGIILFTMLGGRYPFRGGSKAAIIEEIREHLSFLNTDFTPEVRDLIKSMLTKDPKKRATIDELYKCSWLGARKYQEVFRQFYDPSVSANKNLMLSRIFGHPYHKFKASNDSMFQYL